MKADRLWTPEEDAALLALLDAGAGSDLKNSRAMLAQGFKRSQYSVANRRKRHFERLGLIRPIYSRHWGPEETTIVVEMAQCQDKEIVEQLKKSGFPRSVDAVQRRRNKLGLPKLWTKDGRAKSEVIWREREKQIVTANRHASRMRIQACLQQEGFNRSLLAIESFLRRYGIKEGVVPTARMPPAKRQDAKFCAAMRAAPECPPQYRGCND